MQSAVNMKQLRYTGEFASRAGAAWRVDIMQEADAPFDSAGYLTFPADSPLVIEWPREDKEAAILGSNATLKIISPGDRTYEDLYTIEAGRIRMDVYKDNALYWSGALDPEFYEEPYETASGYEVSLTFSDFGILDRVKYDLAGMQTLRDIIAYALQRAGILYGEINTEHVSTTFTDGTPVTGGGLSVRSDNFIDEDGEASTLREAVEGILQPLAARMAQRAGIIYLYDLNGLYSNGTEKAIQWDGDSQTMGTDKAANNVKVTFSPYSGSKLLDGEVGYGCKYDVEHANLTSDRPLVDYGEWGEYYSYYPDYSEDRRIGPDWDYSLIDFTIFICDKGAGLKSKGEHARYFHILPVTGGAAECTGVAYAFRTGGHGGIDTGWPEWKAGEGRGIPRAETGGGNSEVLTTERAFLPKLDEGAGKSTESA